MGSGNTKSFDQLEVGDRVKAIRLKTPGDGGFFFTKEWIEFNGAPEVKTIIECGEKSRAVVLDITPEPFILNARAVIEVEV